RTLQPCLMTIVISLAIIITPFVLLLTQPDLGTATLTLASGGFVLFLAGLLWPWIVGAVSPAVPIPVALSFFIMPDYQKHRVLT
ncbi:FtsW/RodA/SpoVE family cell cycle protein, partial [Pseudomonas aeruginosa]